MRWIYVQLGKKCQLGNKPALSFQQEHAGEIKNRIVSKNWNIGQKIRFLGGFYLSATLLLRCIVGEQHNFHWVGAYYCFLCYEKKIYQCTQRTNFQRAFLSLLLTLLSSPPPLRCAMVSVVNTRGHAELNKKQQIVTTSAAFRLILWSITILKYGGTTVTPRITCIYILSNFCLVVILEIHTTTLVCRCKNNVIHYFTAH